MIFGRHNALTNPHAFPSDSRESGEFAGMTLRDYYAARALQGLLTATSADHDYPNPHYQRDIEGPTNAERVAAICYAYADAMLKERNT